MEHYFPSTFLTVLNMDEHGESKRLDHQEGKKQLETFNWSSFSRATTSVCAKHLQISVAVGCKVNFAVFGVGAKIIWAQKTAGQKRKKYLKKGSFENWLNSVCFEP